MKNVTIKILQVFLIFSIISCSTNKGLIKKEKTDFGTVKYYVETDLNDKDYKKRIIVKVADSVYYSFYSDGINKRTKKDKNSVYKLFYREIPKEMDVQIAYQKLSKLDSVVLSKSDKILDSLKWNDFKRWNGATAFEIEVIYYHGFPKNGKFEPY
jgi:co-chaperonin GroES (HSP10)